MTPEQIAKLITEDPDTLAESEMYGVRTIPVNQDSPRIDQLINMVQAYFIDWDLKNPKFLELAARLYPKSEWGNPNKLALLLLQDLHEDSQQNPKLIEMLKDRLKGEMPPLNLFVFSDEMEEPMITGVAGALKTARDSDWATIYISEKDSIDGDWLGMMHFSNGVLTGVNFGDELKDYQKFNQIPKVKEMSLWDKNGLRVAGNLLKHVLKAGIQVN